MDDAPEQIFIGQHANGRSYNIRIDRAVAAAVSGCAIESEDALIVWADEQMDAILRAADRHRARDGPNAGLWQDLEARDFDHHADRPADRP